MSASRDAKGRLYLVGAPCAPVVTLFRDNKAFHIDDVREMDLAEVERVLRSASPATDKDHLRMIKFATFGEKRSEGGALRQDANVTSVTGLEGDYDDLLMDMEEAIDILRSKNIKALFNTSANYEPQEPKWHVFCPLSEPLKGDEKQLRKQRQHWVGVLNAVLGGVLTEESFVLSQCFYFGPIQGRDAPLIEQVDGLCIDQVEGLPPPEFPPETQGDPRSEAKWIQDFGNGVRKFFSLRSLTWEWAWQGESVESMCQRVDTLCDRFPQSSRTQKGRDLRKGGMKLAQSAWTKCREKGGPRRKQAETPKEEPIELRAFTIEGLQGPIREETYLIEGMVPSEAYTLIAGALASYKTLFLIYLMLLRATGHNFLSTLFDDSTEGEPLSVPGACVLATYEDCDWRIEARVMRIVRYWHEVLLRKHGKTCASKFLADIAKNFRRVPLSGRFGKTLVYRSQGDIHPNMQFVDELIERTREFTSEGVLIGIDPLRLAIVGSQSDDDGADVVVTVLNHTACVIPDSGVVVCSHATKAGAKEAATDDYVDASYSTSGSALYSQHARSNFLMQRMKPQQLKDIAFDPHAVTAEDIARMRVAKLIHGRLSYGEESTAQYVKMSGGILLPLVPRGGRTAVDANDRALPVVAEAIDGLVAAKVPASETALRNDARVRAALGADKRIRHAITMLEEAGFIEFVGKTKGRSAVVTALGRERIARLSRIVTNQGGDSR